MIAIAVPRALRLLVLLTAIGCAGRDATITHGADGQREWSRRLASAIPIGMAADSARTVMERNGFRCSEGADSVAYIWCDKMSEKAIVQRRWQAVLNLDARRRVFEVRASTDLTGA